MANKKSILIVALLLVASPCFSQTIKPFIFGITTSAPLDKKIQKNQACLIKKNLSGHINNMIQFVLPRLQKESYLFLEKNSVKDESFFVAERLDFFDLYHSHWRINGGVDVANFDELLAPSFYHLQYHSGENPELLKKSWLLKIESSVSTPEHKKWVQERLAATNKSGSSSTGGSGAMGGGGSPKPYLLADAELTKMARVWHESLGIKSPSEKNLLVRLKVLNDAYIGYDAVKELERFRSIASFNDQFVIVPKLKIEGYWQPVDFFYEKISSNTKIAEEIQNFTSRTQQLWVGNLESLDGTSLYVPTEIKDDMAATFNRIKAHVKSSDENNVFKNVMSAPSLITAFAVSGEFVFAFRYNISNFCP